MEWINGVVATNSLGSESALTLMSLLFLAGLISGCSGFALAAVAVCILWLLPPLQAIPLIMLLSTCNQIFSVSRVPGDMPLFGPEASKRAMPYIVGGLVGVPIGLILLMELSSATFAGYLGTFLLLYSAFGWGKRDISGLSDTTRLKLAGLGPTLVVGAIGGIVGGFSAFPGAIPVMYLRLLGKTRIETRGIVQPYILALQVLSLVILAAISPDVFGGIFWLLVVTTLPAALVGTMLGVELYRRMSEVTFRRTVLLLLIASGTSLVAKSLIHAA